MGRKKKIPYAEMTDRQYMRAKRAEEAELRRKKDAVRTATILMIAVLSFIYILTVL